MIVEHEEAKHRRGNRRKSRLNLEQHEVSTDKPDKSSQRHQLVVRHVGRSRVEVLDRKVHKQRYDAAGNNGHDSCGRLGVRKHWNLREHVLARHNRERHDR